MGRNRRPSKQMLLLLEALSAHTQQWRHGYDLMKETGLL
jgi:PadR family transcriptional regulator PadR